MKRTQHYFLISLFVGAFFIVNSAQTAPFKDNAAALQDMRTTLNRVFHSHDNVLHQPLEYKALDAFMAQLDEYIATKITIKVIGKDKDIDAAYTRLKSYLYKLTNGIKTLYNAYVFKPNKSAQDRQNMNTLAANFVQAGDAFKKEQSNLSKIRSKALLSDKKEALDLLTIFAKSLEEIAFDTASAYQMVVLEGLD